MMPLLTHKHTDSKLEESKDESSQESIKIDDPIIITDAMQPKDKHIKVTNVQQTYNSIEVVKSYHTIKEKIKEINDSTFDKKKRVVRVRRASTLIQPLQIIDYSNSIT